MQRLRDPWSSLLLSLAFPGLGQIHNGQTRKAWTIAIVFIIIPFAFGIFNVSTNPIGFLALISIMISAFVWQSFDAYAIAKKASIHLTQQIKSNWYSYVALVCLWTAIYFQPQIILRIQSFSIPTPSMEDGLLVGDRIVVDMYETKITNNDIIVFHVPGIRENNILEYDQSKWDTLAIKNKSPYVKRCIGLPGDVLLIKDKKIRINDRLLNDPATLKYQYNISCKEKLTERTLKKFGLDENDVHVLALKSEGIVEYSMYLTQNLAKAIKDLPSFIQMEERRIEYMEVFPFYNNIKWTVDNYGPLRVPCKGMTISINDSTLAFYGTVIKEYEHNENVSMNSSKLSIQGKKITEYTFKQNYYFAMGDNRHNALDSRYWGFVPEDHLMGKVRFVYFSFNNFTKSIRWDRCLSVVE